MEPHPGPLLRKERVKWNLTLALSLERRGEA